MSLETVFIYIIFVIERFFKILMDFEMKKLIIIILLSFPINANSQTGWFDVTIPINNLYLESIQFPSPNTGYACGDIYSTSTGYLLKTTNEGYNWQNIFIDFARVYSLFFINNNTGFIVGDNSTSGIIAKTTNGGNNWIIINTGFSIGFYTIFFVDDNVGYVGGKYNDVRKTTDGGNTWISKPGVISLEINSIYFLNVNTGFIVENLGGIIKTTNGGDNWIQTNMPFTHTCVKFANNLVGYICTFQGHIIKTTNAGTNWSIIDSIDCNLTSLCFINQNTGYTCGTANKIFKTTDGGYNWIQQTTTNLSWWNSIYFSDIDNGYVSGLNGRIMKTTNGGVFINQISSKIPNKFSLSQNYPNPFNPNTKIKFQIAKLSDVKLVVYDILGCEVATLVNERLKAGTYEVDFEGRELPSGVYFYTLISESFKETKKMVLTK